ncbi:MAG: DUF1538 domain-containing protein [Candidatus Borkfalkiaceae bacterium]|nr:DUF1538 domain-containing protein [Clostridia bacterium]MDY6222677.1 DUF1538 domain-containing protein [Christensenellaceae bacterium]
MINAIKEKLKESLSSVLPVALIVALLAVTVAPVDSGIFLSFLAGAALLVFGMALFTLGADSSMLEIGKKAGASLTASKKVWLIAFVSFVIGVIVTVAEPDLQILAAQVEGIGRFTLILSVAAGVGLFLTFAMLRIVFGVSFKIMLAVLYPLAFLLALLFVDKSFWALAFDAGGVTTGPMTVPFIMALGVGVAAIHKGKKGNDSFGLVALSSIGPVIAVLILGMIYSVSGKDLTAAVTVPETTRSVLRQYGAGMIDYAKEVGIALSPILAFFLLFQLFAKAFSRRQFIKVCVGLLYTFAGLTLFLTGANVGFMPVGAKMGETLANIGGGWLLVPVGAAIGYYMVAAEPAVYVLNKEVEHASAGAISAKDMKRGLCAGVSFAVALAFFRILVGFNIMWALIIGYAAALILMIFCPSMFTGIAFDSGGVASGAMVSSFVLPMAKGACAVIAPGQIMTLAFGCVALVALAPLISIQILGVSYKRKTAIYKRTFLNEEDTFVNFEVD